MSKRSDRLQELWTTQHRLTSELELVRKEIDSIIAEVEKELRESRGGLTKRLKNLTKKRPRITWLEV